MPFLVHQTAYYFFDNSFPPFLCSLLLEHLLAGHYSSWHTPLYCVSFPPIFLHLIVFQVYFYKEFCSFILYHSINFKIFLLSHLENMSLISFLLIHSFFTFISTFCFIGAMPFLISLMTTYIFSSILCFVLVFNVLSLFFSVFRIRNFFKCDLYLFTHI